MYGSFLVPLTYNKINEYYERGNIMQKQIVPSKLSGTVQVPSSKSVNHRAIISASLSTGTSRIENVFISDDINATIGAMRALGADIIEEGNTLVINGVDLTQTSFQDPFTIDCAESGSTLRFIIPIIAAVPGHYTLTGRGLLLQRPMTPFEGMLDQSNVTYEFTESHIVIDSRESQLKAGTYHLPGDISSQFITGLLFILPILEDDSEIIIDSPLESTGYIDLTIDTLADFAVLIKRLSYEEYHIKGQQTYESTDYAIEGDYSQAAFFLVANHVGHEIELGGLKPDSKQSDKELITFLNILNTATGPVTLDGSNCPDIIPALALACSVASHPIMIENVGRLRIKECDRLNATVTELNKLGANLIEHESAIEVIPVDGLQGGTVVESYNDHRMAMMLAIAGTICTSAIEINEAQSVTKSYPTFWDEFERLQN